MLYQDVITLKMYTRYHVLKRTIYNFIELFNFTI